MKRLLCLIVSFCSFSMLLACSRESQPSVELETTPPQITSTPYVDLLPTPTSEETMPPDAEAFHAFMSTAMDFSALEAILTPLEVDRDWSFLDALSNMAALKEAALSMQGAIQDAYSKAEALYRQKYPNAELRCMMYYTPFEWKYLSGIAYAASASADYLNAVFIEVTAVQLVSGSWQLTVKAGPKAFQEALYAIAKNDRDSYMSAQYITTYLTTVFDDQGKLKEYEPVELTAAYKETIANPLDTASFYDSWYQARSSGVRLHTGLDLRTAENEPIYSCTDGTVLFIGYQSTPGYYVVILDPCGYEYHYYHMVRQTDFLEEGQAIMQGDLIGHVGNTGNSATDHLHLGLISPDSRFVKLFNLFYDRYYLGIWH